MSVTVIYISFALTIGEKTNVEDEHRHARTREGGRKKFKFEFKIPTHPLLPVFEDQPALLCFPCLVLCNSTSLLLQGKGHCLIFLSDRRIELILGVVDIFNLR